MRDAVLQRQQSNAARGVGFTLAPRLTRIVSESGNFQRPNITKQNPSEKNEMDSTSAKKSGINNENCNRKQPNMRATTRKTSLKMVGYCRQRCRSDRIWCEEWQQIERIFAGLEGRYRLR
ncbi:Hypothetical protein CINCED_3A012944 [Cinara cedri]|uniref:Uncharacterized protein n=1 Tax=Cinara cedri TaxID=506608 RepID=A0A5E4MA95_9HEMI|nr:Hypothetical protein CINCED_3A012944 [Cinara cedri]